MHRVRVQRRSSCLCRYSRTAQRSARQVRFIKTDTSSEADCLAAVAWTCETYGGLDVLVNNAAIQPPASYVPVHELDSSLAQRMVGVNFMGYTYMAKHALNVMQAQRSGVVINIASGQGDRTARGVPIYGPIKAANILQAMQWAVEYARQGIRVVSLSPGAIETPLVKASWQLKVVPMLWPIDIHWAASVNHMRSPLLCCGWPARTRRSSRYRSGSRWRFERVRFLR